MKIPWGIREYVFDPKGPMVSKISKLNLQDISFNSFDFLDWFRKNVKHMLTGTSSFDYSFYTDNASLYFYYSSKRGMLKVVSLSFWML